MIKIDCPCEDCICVGICRHKRCPSLFNECTLLQEYEPCYKNPKLRDKNRIFLLEDILKPTLWKCEYDHTFSSRCPLIKPRSGDYI